MSHSRLANHIPPTYIPSLPTNSEKYSKNHKHPILVLLKNHNHSLNHHHASCLSCEKTSLIETDSWYSSWQSKMREVRRTLFALGPRDTGQLGIARDPSRTTLRMAGRTTFISSASIVNQQDQEEVCLETFDLMRTAARDRRDRT